jgi:3-hydroxybutyryl-CoA dehydrogenase
VDGGRPVSAPISTVERVGVVGCGAMGAGFAEICALAGLDIRVVVSGPAAVDRGRARIIRAFDRAVAKERITGAERDAAVARLSVTADLDELGDRQLVLESVPEDEGLKLDLFRRLDKVVTDPAAVLASNTSSLPIIALARATGRPELVVGLHFFHPVPVLRLVEVTPSLLTGADTVAAAESFVTGALGKEVVRCGDRAGFVVNALLVPYLVAAVRMVESGFATAVDVDRAMTLGCAHPLGPLALADLCGLDIVAAAAEALYQEFKEPLYAPPPLLARMVQGGLLGRKTGQGFHTYEE